MSKYTVEDPQATIIKMQQHIDCLKEQIRKLEKAIKLRNTKISDLQSMHVGNYWL